MIKDDDGGDGEGDDDSADNDTDDYDFYGYVVDDDDDIGKEDDDNQWESSIQVQSLNMGIAHLRNDSRRNSGCFLFNCHNTH